MLTRVAKATCEWAPSNMRQYLPRGSAGTGGLLTERHFPQLAQEENKYQALLGRVIKAQAELVAQWMLVGFIQGVMNTDNMAISGETIDYGPCAFMDTYDPKTVFSSIDQDGRYAYGNQPHIAAWNLARFAESLLPLLADNEEQAVQLANEELAQFAPLYNQFYLDGMRQAGPDKPGRRRQLLGGGSA